MRVTLILLVAFLLLPVSAAVAQDGLPPLLDRELFFGNPEYAGAQVSPDGEFITFRRPFSGVMNIWIKAAGEPIEDARPLTADTRPVFGYFWTPDSRYVLYIQDRDGDENFHVFRIDPTASGEGYSDVPPAVNITPVDGARALIHAVPRNRPDIALVGLNDRDPAWHDLYEVNISTGERTLLVENDRQITSWIFDHDGVAHVATRTETATGGTQILPVRDGTLGEPIYSCSVRETCSPIRLHPDGRQVYLMTNYGAERDLTEFVLLDLETGAETFVERDPNGRVDFAGASFSSVDDRLLLTYYIGDRVEIHFRDSELEADFAFLRERLPEGDVQPASGTMDERTMLVSVSSDVDPGSVHVFDRDARTVEQLYTSRPQLPTEHLAEMRPIRYVARDGLEIPAYLTLPRGVEPENLPLVVWPHGGPWARDIWRYDSYAQFFANRGYAVLQPNFRGSTGFGKAFLDAGDGEWGTGDMQHDITDGVQYLVAQGIVDPDRVGIAGISYGGYATLAGLAFTPELYAAGASIVGPSNLVTLLNSIPAYWESFRRELYQRMADPNDPEGRELLVSQSPFFNADAITAPLLVVQGANDPRVVQHESDQIVVAMRDRNRPVEYLVAPDEGHGFRDETNQLAMIVAMERFFADHLGGRLQRDVSGEVADRLAAITVDPATVELAEVEDITDLTDAEFGGSQIAPVSLTYHTAMSVMGQELELEQTTTAEEVDFEGSAAWLFTSSGSLMGQQLSDSIYVHRETLAPLSRRMQQGPQHIVVEYGDGEVSADVGPMGTLSATFDGDLFVDGAAFDVGLGTLPLAEGYRSRVQLFDLMQSEVKSYSVVVTGTEQVTVPAGTFEAFVVEVRPADGSAPRVMHVSNQEPRVIVRQVAPLPAQMGGGTATSELLSIEQ